jgi:hypothetical protein
MNKKYTASFTTGALLFDEMERIVRFMADKYADRQLISKTSEVLTINSEAARIRQSRELLKRFDSVDLKFWDFYRGLSDKDSRKMAVYYACLKTYPLVLDFHMEVVLAKWRQLNYNLDTTDVIKFLKWSESKHPEIDDWKESTFTKISRIVILMLKEAGILIKGKLHPVQLPERFWIYFLEIGEGWFLEAMLLSKEQRESLFNKA